MSSIRDDDPEVQSAETPFEPTPEDWAWVRAHGTTRDGSGGDAPAPRPSTLPDCSEWFGRQVAWYDSRSRETDDYHGLISTALGDVRCVFAFTGCRSARALAARPGHPYSRLDLDAVSVPLESRASHLATLLDEDAQYYLDLGTDLGRLAAHAVLSLADQAEAFGSQTVAEFLDDEAAWLEAARTVFDDLDLPLW